MFCETFKTEARVKSFSWICGTSYVKSIYVYFFSILESSLYLIFCVSVAYSRERKKLTKKVQKWLHKLFISMKFVEENIVKLKQIFIPRNFFPLYLWSYRWIKFYLHQTLRRIYEAFKRNAQTFSLFLPWYKIDIIYPIKLLSNAELKLKHQISNKQV